MESLLRVRDLIVQFRQSAGTDVQAVRGVSFDMKPGEAVGLLGESGCGKTTIALAILRLLPYTDCLIRGSIRFEGRELLGLSENDLAQIRGARISMVSQEPGIALNPVITVGDQVAEVIRAHKSYPRKRRQQEVESLLAEVGLADTIRVYDSFPHQLSGGQQQRVLIAQALACRPALVVADEPISSLDTSTQARILSLLKELKERSRISLLLITHNPATLVGLADRVLVMYAGRIVEEGDTEQILSRPFHPYTRGLLQSLPPPPRGGSFSDRKGLQGIAGNPPDPAHLPAGCSFAPRCPQRMEICIAREPQTIMPEGSRRVECFVYGQ